MKLSDYSPAKFRSSLARRGLVPTIVLGARYLLSPLGVYSPFWFAKRIRDRMFDRWHGVDTSREILLKDLRIETSNADLGHKYQATPQKWFHRSIAGVPVRYEDFIFLDFGSGKGKCLLMASDYPFRRILGIEFADELNVIARHNFTAYRSRRQKCKDLACEYGDATSCELPAGQAIYYFANPFEGPMLAMVLENIRRSLEAKPRKLYFIYYNPEFREVFDSAPWLKPLQTTKRFCIYESR